MQKLSKQLKSKDCQETKLNLDWIKNLNSDPVLTSRIQPAADPGDE